MYNICPNKDAVIGVSFFHINNVFYLGVSIMCKRIT